MKRRRRSFSRFSLWTLTPRQTLPAVSSRYLQVLLKSSPPQIFTRWLSIISSRDTSKRIFFVPKYGSPKHYFTVWPADRESEAVIPSTGASSECKNELLVILLAACKGPQGAPCCHRRMDSPPLMSNSAPPPLLHHLSSFFLPYLLSSTKKYESHILYALKKNTHSE